MRFYDRNILFSSYGGTISGSSNASLTVSAFDENKRTQWFSSGENTDGNSVFLENILVNQSNIDTIFILNTNINNITIEVDIGAGYVSLSNFTLTKSNDGRNYYYKLNSTISILKIKISGSNTITANQEKEIGEIMAFEELGRIAYYDDIKGDKIKLQTISKLRFGKVDIITHGQYYTFKLKLKNHYVSNDNAIIELLMNRDYEFFIWINDNDEDNIVMYQEPYRFEDVYKVVIQKKVKADYKDNYTAGGINLDLDLIEVY